MQTALIAQYYREEQAAYAAAKEAEQRTGKPYAVAKASIANDDRHPLSPSSGGFIVYRVPPEFAKEVVN